MIMNHTCQSQCSGMLVSCAASAPIAHGHLFEEACSSTRVWLSALMAMRCTRNALKIQCEMTADSKFEHIPICLYIYVPHVPYIAFLHAPENASCTAEWLLASCDILYLLLQEALLLLPAELAFHGSDLEIEVQNLLKLLLVISIK